jgi:2-hydroxychromene-2-carboxylate isomerase
LVEEVTDLSQTVAPDLFTAFNSDLFPMTSLPALALAASAYRTGTHRGEHVSCALRHALFEEGRNISDTTELLRIVQLATLDDIRTGEHDVQADYAEGRERGVIGSPHFFVGDEGYFCPTLAIERIDGHLSISFDAEGFNEFIDRCFG